MLFHIHMKYLYKDCIYMILLYIINVLLIPVATSLLQLSSSSRPAILQHLGIFLQIYLGLSSSQKLQNPSSWLLIHRLGIPSF